MKGLFITFTPQYVREEDTEEIMEIIGIFAASDNVMRSLTITEKNAGTYTSFVDDGNSGTVELSYNSGSFAVFSSPLQLKIGDTLQGRRSSYSMSGFLKLTGSSYNRILSFKFGIAEDTSDLITINSDSAGTYIDIANTGTNGTLTYSKNGGAYATFPSSLTLNGGDTIRFKRTTTSAIGDITIYGN